MIIAEGKVWDWLCHINRLVNDSSNSGGPVIGYYDGTADIFAAMARGAEEEGFQYFTDNALEKRRQLIELGFDGTLLRPAHGINLVGEMEPALLVLTDRGVKVMSHVRKQILPCLDYHVMKRWTQYAHPAGEWRNIIGKPLPDLPQKG